MKFNIKDVEDFKASLISKGKSENTIKAYVSDIMTYFNNKSNYSSLEKYSISTLQRRKCSFNAFCEFTGNYEEKIKNNFKKSYTFQRESIEINHVQKMLNFLRLKFNMVKTFKSKKRIYQQIIFLLLGNNEGLRVCEYHNVDFIDVIYRDEIHIKNSKNQTFRTLPITNVTKEIIMEFKKFLKLDNQKVDSKVFKNNRNKYISIRTFQRWIRDIANNSKVPINIAHTHSLRHRFAVNFLKANPQNIAYLSNLMGHKSIQTTLIYAIPTKQELKNKMENACLIRL